MTENDKPRRQAEGIGRDRLAIPNKLYGRDRDIARLLESFERVGRGHGEVLLVPGSSGVGKTALVQELRSPVRDRNGVFIQGKFDQYQQNSPYFAFRQALADLCGQLQSGNAQQRTRWKADILQAVGGLGQLLVDLVPEFESFIGAQPPLGSINPQEGRHRFVGVFQNFINVFCRPEHPLVLFIDDWQWADVASLNLLRQMQVGGTLRYLLVIVSYRDNEVDSAHPLTPTLDDMRSRSVPVEVLQVKDITADDVRVLVADTLKPATKNIEGLAAFIHGRTLGNPFFVRSFLGFLHEFNLIGFDAPQNCWQWHVDKIEEANLPRNAFELFVLKLRRLDADTRRLFVFAACLGSRFDLETLSIISERPPGECLALLFSDQAKTMILLLDVGESNGPAGNLRVPRQACKFLHDQVQQAAYTLIAPAELPAILLKTGRLLLASLHPEQLAERVFDVVRNLNAGYHLIQDTAEQVTVFRLNMTAARKAYAATAYRAALQFYQAASSFLEQPGLAEQLWRDAHELTMSLFKERAGCEFLEGNRADAENCIQQAVAHAGTAIEKADAITILIVHYTLLAWYPEAIAAGRQALISLGISLPEGGFEEARDEEIAQLRQALGNRPVSSLIDLPLMSHPEMLMASKILITMGPPCYRSHQLLWGVIVPKVVNLTVRYGNIPQVGYSHPALGGLLGWAENDYSTAKAFGELATRLMTGTFSSPSDQSVFYLMIGSSIRHWFSHLKHSTQDYADAFEIGLQSGNLQYAAYAFGHNMYCRFYQGTALAELIQESQHSLEFSRTRLNQWAIDLLEGGLGIFDELTRDDPALNGHAARREGEYLRRVEDHHNIQVACIYKVLRTFTLLVLGHHDRALMLSDEAEALIYTVGTQGLLLWPEHVFARLLIFTALYSKAAGARQARWRPELERTMSRLRIWADNGPENFEHKYLLAAAELARIDDRPVDAMRLYDEAAEAAHAGSFLQWEGMANERACSFWLERGNERLAHVYWQQAYVCYDRWGAAGKVRSMETAYRAYFADKLPDGDGPGTAAGTPERDIWNALLEKQIERLRTHASQMRQAGPRVMEATQAAELARATGRLRVEIAERKRSEEEQAKLEGQLHQAQKMESIGTLAGGIAHDFNNILSVVIGHAEVLNFKDDIGTSTRNSLNQILAASQRAKQLVHQILAFSRQGKQEKILISLKPIVKEGLEFLRASLPSLIELRHYVEPDAGTIMADPTQMQQILMNLCVNAGHAMEKDGGVLQIKLSNAALTEEDTRLNPDVEPGDFVKLTVSDTGHGMGTSVLQRIFDPYFTTKEPGKGTGLGLSVVHGIVKSHGGMIKVDSEVGKGTTFTIFLPRAMGFEKVNNAPLQPLAMGTEKILFVDDENALADLGRQLLGELGYQVETRTSPIEALEAFRANPQKFDLVISDLTMPQMSGLKLSGKLMEIRPDMPIILCTGFSEQTNEQAAAAMGVRAFLLKPLVLRDIADAVRKALDSKNA